tara:strand:- start:443 stop:1036 length:594 start_codon:yes stop_codon:yes gene_type:complete
MPSLIFPDAADLISSNGTFASVNQSSQTTATVDATTTRGWTFLENSSSALVNADPVTNYFAVSLLYHTPGAGTWTTADLATNAECIAKYVGLFSNFTHALGTPAAYTTYQWSSANEYLKYNSPPQVTVQNTTASNVTYNYVAFTSISSNSSWVSSIHYTQGRIIALLAEDSNVTLTPGQFSAGYSIKPVVSWYNSYP